MFNAKTRRKTAGLNVLAPQVGFEPTTYRLTAGCSTLELLRNIILLRMQQN